MPQTLEVPVHIPVKSKSYNFETTSTLQTVNKVGGLDNYLLTTKYVTSGEGLVVNQQIM